MAGRAPWLASLLLVWLVSGCPASEEDGRDAAPSKSDASDVVAAPSGPGVPCGGATCAAFNEACCHRYELRVCAARSPAGVQGHCRTSADTFVLSCDGDEDCGSNQRCCFSTYTERSSGTFCVRREGAAFPCGTQVCKTNADCAEPYATCCPVLPELKVCNKAPCPTTAGR
jgi:hypothetical protein